MDRVSALDAEGTKERGGPERPAEGGRNIRKDPSKSTAETPDLGGKTGRWRRSSGRLPGGNRPLISVARERWRSGRSGRSRKPLCVQAYRGFESHPLRQRCLRAHPRPSVSSSKYGRICWLLILEL